jgi:integrase
LRKAGFATAAEAATWRAKKMAEKAGVRAKANELSVAESADAGGALEKLHARGFTEAGILTRAAVEFLNRHPSSTPTKVKAFYETWIDLKRKALLRPRSIGSSKTNIREFLSSFGEKNLTEVTLADVESVVSKLSKGARSRVNQAGAITNLFNEARDRGLIGDNPKDHPCNGLKLPTVDDPPPDPFTLSEAQRLLNFAWKTEDETHCTAYIAIGLFCGLRTEELLRARFGVGDVDMARGLVTVSAVRSKKRRARKIEMPANLRDILSKVQSRPRKTKKHCSPKMLRPTDTGSKVVSPKFLARFRKALAADLPHGGGLEWKDNGLRSSFGSHEFERTGDLENTITKMGHTGDTVTFYNHYRGLVDPGDGAKFNALTITVLNEPQQGGHPQGFAEGQSEKSGQNITKNLPDSGNSVSRTD